MSTFVLIFVAWNYMSGGYINLSPSVNSLEQCLAIKHDLEIKFANNHTILKNDCYGPNGPIKDDKLQ